MEKSGSASLLAITFLATHFFQPFEKSCYRPGNQIWNVQMCSVQYGLHGCSNHNKAYVDLCSVQCGLHGYSQP